MRLFLVSFLFALSAWAADATGSWSGTGEVEGESHPLYFVLKQEGSTLTGSGGPDRSEQHSMQNGKIQGEKLIFDVPAGKGTLHFELTPDGDSMKGTVQMKSDEGDSSGTVSLKRTA